MWASAQEAAITKKTHNSSAGQVRSGPVSAPGAAPMSRLQLKTGAGHRRGREGKRLVASKGYKLRYRPRRFKSTGMRQ